MLEYLTLGQFVVAVLMGLAALCAFLWGAASGALSDVEAAKYQVLLVEDDVAGGGEPGRTASRRFDGSVAGGGEPGRTASRRFDGSKNEPPRA